MKVLVATSKTQGQRENDFHFANEGEVVIFGSECDREAVDGKCGCRRSMVGCESRKATTTFLVVERPIDQAGLETTVRMSLTEGGWVGKEWSDPAADAEWVREDAAELARVAAHFATGTVLEKRGTTFKERRVHRTAAAAFADKVKAASR